VWVLGGEGKWFVADRSDRGGVECDDVSRRGRSGTNRGYRQEAGWEGKKHNNLAGREVQSSLQRMRRNGGPSRDEKKRKIPDVQSRDHEEGSRKKGTESRGNVAMLVTKVNEEHSKTQISNTS